MIIPCHVSMHDSNDGRVTRSRMRVCLYVCCVWLFESAQPPLVIGRPGNPPLFIRQAHICVSPSNFHKNSDSRNVLSLLLELLNIGSDFGCFLGRPTFPSS